MARGGLDKIYGKVNKLGRGRGASPDVYPNVLRRRVQKGWHSALFQSMAFTLHSNSLSDVYIKTVDGVFQI
jgi:hypothetical protein